MGEEQEKIKSDRLDARSYILCAFAFSLVTACVDKLSAALAALMISFCVLPFVWQKRLAIARRLWAANLFILFLWLITPFTTPGETVLQWGILHISREGLYLAILVTVKANALAIIFLSLAASLPVSSMGAALARLHCPHKLIWLFIIMERNIHTLQKEWNSLWDAARLRSFRPGNNLHTYRTMGSLLGLFLIRAIQRAHILHEALLLKGYDGRLPFQDKSSFHSGDYVLWLCCALSILAILLAESGFLYEWI